MQWRALAVAACLALVPGPGAAQDWQTRSPLLTLDQERLFTQSEFGQRVLADLERDAKALATENRQIEAELTEEERDLTERRPDMDAEAFRKLADAFDAKVVAIRERQETRAREIEARTETERKRFFDAALPVLLEIVRESGAVALLENRAIILAADKLDITDQAIARVNATLGSGETIPGPAPGTGQSDGSAQE